MGIVKWLTNKKTETRASLTSASSWFTSAFTGSPTASGQKVTTDSALRQPAVFACVRVISEDVASLPCKIYVKDANGDRTSLSNHPVAKLLHTQPNPEMSPFTFKEVMTAHVLTYGNAYAEIESNGAGEPIALWILLPEKMQIKVVEGTLVYEYDNRLRLPSNKVFHLRGLGHDGILGYSPISYARETIGISQAMEQAGGSFFANSSRPSGVLSHPAKLSEDASKRLRKGWDGMYSGSGNIGRTAILEEGMKWESLSIPHSDAQWIEARQFALQDIARMYRVPPHMIGDLSRATFSNIESQQISYMQQTIMPWLRRWEQEINRKLIGVENDNLYAEFLAEEILRGNTSERFDAYRTARESGWMSVNEIREKENLNKIDSGDSYIQPLNFTDVTLAKEIQKPEQERQQQTIEKEWLCDSIDRAVSIIKNASNRKAKKLDDAEWHLWISKPDEQLLRKTEEIIAPCCKSMGLNSEVLNKRINNSWQEAVTKAITQEQRLQTCDNWATRTVKNIDGLTNWNGALND